MELNTYQREAGKTAQYPDNLAILYPLMGVAGEAGEALEIAKKACRKGQLSISCGLVLSKEQEDALLLELGDVLWYIANTALDMGITLEEIAKTNLAKLTKRAKEDKIKEHE